MADVPNSLRYRLELARSYGSLGNYLKSCGQRGAAEECFAKACAECSSLVEACPDDPAMQSEYGRNLRDAGDVFRIIQRPREAERALRQAIDLHRRLVAKFPAVVEYRENLAAADRPLAEILYEARNLQGAEQLLREIVELLEELVTRSPNPAPARDFLAGSSILLAMVLWESGQSAEAAKAMERGIQLRWQLAKDFPERNMESGLVTGYASYGALLSSLRRFPDAESALQQALELEQKAVNKQPTHGRPEAALVYAQLATVYVAPASRWQKARQALPLVQKALELKPNDTAHLTILGAVYCRLGQWDQAIATFRHAVEIDGRMTGSLRDWTSDNSPLTRIAQLHAESAGVLRWFYLALCYQHRGEPTEARECYQQGLVSWNAQRQELAPRVHELEAMQAETAAALGVADADTRSAYRGSIR